MLGLVAVRVARRRLPVGQVLFLPECFLDVVECPLGLTPERRRLARVSGVWCVVVV